MRSPIYCDHGAKRSEESNYTDQGEQEFSYALYPATTGDKASIFRRALQLNNPCTLVLENNHNGVLPLEYSGIFVEKENILITALKKSYDGRGFVLRAYECAGEETRTEISVKGVGEAKVKFSPYEVKTFYITPDNQWTETLFMEYK